MTHITESELLAHVAETLDRVSAGERIVLDRAGHPPVALVPMADLDEMADELPAPITTRKPLTRDFVDQAISEGRG